MEYADRLMGETEEEWKKDAETLAKDFAAAHASAPLGSPEPSSQAAKATRTQFAEWVNENMGN